MNNIHFASTYSRCDSFCFAELHLTIALVGLWMGASCTKKCDGAERNSGNETGESKRAQSTGATVSRRKSEGFVIIYTRSEALSSRG